MRAQDQFVDVIMGEMGACGDADQVREAPSMQVAYVGDLGYQLDRKLWFWFVYHFIDDPAERARIYRAIDEVRAVFADLAKLNKAMGGPPMVFPEKLIACLERRLLAAMRPSGREISVGATRHPAARASAALKRLSEEAWQTKS